MHTIEPFYNWLDKYTAEADKYSPFYGNEYNELAYHTTIYNYYIHPQWDSIESEDLYVKLLFTEYFENYAIIELFGVWNDAIENDVELLLNQLIYPLMKEGINKFILIGEHVLNFHGEMDDYYAEWFETVNEADGWIVGVNFREHVIDEMERYGVTNYITTHYPFNSVKWRSYQPEEVYMNIDKCLNNWLEEGLRQIEQ